jgi:AcrR family transcriptional regulator
MTARRITVRGLRGEAERYEKPQTELEAAIIQAATRLFGERGYDATRAAQVASMAGVTERTLFRYFPTKNALYRTGTDQPAGGTRRRRASSNA